MYTWKTLSIQKSISRSSAKSHGSHVGKLDHKKTQMALNIVFPLTVSQTKLLLSFAVVYVFVPRLRPLYIFSYTCRTSRSCWTAAPTCVSGPRSRGLAVAPEFGGRSMVGLRLLDCDACTRPRSVNICFQHSRYRYRNPCSSWRGNPWACGSTSILNLS